MSSDSDFKPVYVFVYGTLKGMHHSRGSKLVGVARTTDKYVLYDGGFPSVRPPVGEDAPNADAAGHVLGELHLVEDEKTLHRLDSYEGHPSFFERKQITVFTQALVNPLHEDDDAGFVDGVWMYIGPQGSVHNRKPITPGEDETVAWR